MTPARACTRTARSGVEHTNHEATAPPTTMKSLEVFLSSPSHPPGWDADPSHCRISNQEGLGMSL